MFLTINVVRGSLFNAFSSTEPVEDDEEEEEEEDDEEEFWAPLPVGSPLECVCAGSYCNPASSSRCSFSRLLLSEELSM